MLFVTSKVSVIFISVSFYKSSSWSVHKTCYIMNQWLDHSASFPFLSWLHFVLWSLLHWSLQTLMTNLLSICQAVIEMEAWEFIQNWHPAQVKGEYGWQTQQIRLRFSTTDLLVGYVCLVHNLCLKLTTNVKDIPAGAKSFLDYDSFGMSWWGIKERCPKLLSAVRWCQCWRMTVKAFLAKGLLDLKKWKIYPWSMIVANARKSTACVSLHGLSSELGISLFILRTPLSSLCSSQDFCNAHTNSEIVASSFGDFFNRL